MFKVMTNILQKINCVKPLFHSSQKPTCELAASTFKYCDWMKVFTASLGFVMSEKEPVLLVFKVFVQLQGFNLDAISIKYLTH